MPHSGLVKNGKAGELLYGKAGEVANIICSANADEISHADLMAALGNALNRIE